jgi:hypothetical protein
MMVVTWRYSTVTSGASHASLSWIWSLAAGWSHATNCASVCLRQREQARPTASQPSQLEMDECGESLVWLLSLKPACKWCAFMRRRAWTASEQRKSLLRKKAVALALVGWMDVGEAGGGQGSRKGCWLRLRSSKLEARLDVGVSVGAPATEHWGC